jgi:programmed cell death protein 5
MNNLQAVSNINPGDLPEGFSAADPNSASSSAQQQAQAAREQKDALLQQALTPEAWERLNRIKLVKDTSRVEQALLNMALSGQMTSKINEGKLIELLERGNAKAVQASRPISIQRKKYAIDDEDDNDDDLL